MQHAPHVNTTRSLFTDRARSVFIKTINTHYAKNCLGLNDGGGSHNPHQMSPIAPDHHDS